MDKEGYKGHHPGSNKGKVHQVYDEKGPEAAIKKAESLELQTTTVRTWISTWKKKPGAKAPAKKPVAKKVVAKKAAAPAKKTAKKTAPAKKVVRERVPDTSAAA